MSCNQQGMGLGGFFTFNPTFPVAAESVASNISHGYPNRDEFASHCLANWRGRHGLP